MDSVGEIDAFLDEALSHGLGDGHALPSQRDPKVILTYAQSLDARIAGAGGKQLVLSGKESMAMTHRLRARCTAILVGAGTLLNDDPQLNCRIPTLLSRLKQPEPFVFDSQCRTPSSARLLQNMRAGTGKAPVVVCSETAVGTTPSRDEDLRHRAGQLQRAGCELWPIRSDADGHLDIGAFMDMLAEKRPHATLMVEGGSRIISSFLYSGCVSNLIVTVAPTMVGDEGVPVMQSGSNRSKPAPTLRHKVTKQFGRDTVIACSIEQTRTEL